MTDAPASQGQAEAAQPVTQKVDEMPGIKIFVGNLDYSVTNDDLRKFFNVVESDILAHEVIQRRFYKSPTGFRSAGYGFVAVKTDDAAQKAIDALNGTEFKVGEKSRAAIVERAKPLEEKEKDRSEKRFKRRFGRRGTKAVPGEVTEAEANGETEKPAADTEAGGENKPKKKKKSTFKKYKKQNREAGAEAAATGEGAEATSGGEGEKKKSPRPKRVPRPRRNAGEEPTGEQSKTTLFVANLPFSLDDEGLSALFTEAGFSVSSARVVRRRWGHPRKSKGYGFVELEDETQQQAAMTALQNKEIGTGKEARQIAIKVAVNLPAEETEEGEEKAPVAEGGAEEVAAA
ncbi:RNA-binding domain-containing [Pyrrhoderma noxium]|uniref:RNA-binding domain-containing n=1 Tax=Pyrrhoderma noxium TaxID=2282107 RepID=A0A286UMB6_9AGAM|nr:RNA-binding domain-containing [Pyrrhoderma noxium]